MSFGLKTSFGRICSGQPRKRNETFEHLHNLLHLYQHKIDSPISHFELSTDVIEKIYNRLDRWNDYKSIWHINIIELTTLSHANIVSKPDNNGFIFTISTNLSWQCKETYTL